MLKDYCGGQAAAAIAIGIGSLPLFMDLLIKTMELNSAQCTKSEPKRFFLSRTLLPHPVVLFQAAITKNHKNLDVVELQFLIYRLFTDTAFISKLKRRL